jgi:hypothetical protein
MDDATYTNKMHPECLAAHEYDAQGLEWEYMPYDSERPNVK